MCETFCALINVVWVWEVGGGVACVCGKERLHGVGSLLSPLTVFGD